MTAAAVLTSTSPAKPRRYSVGEYLQVEIQTNQKYYFINGTLIPMAGGTLPHNRIAVDVASYLNQKLEGNPNFEVFGSDQKIYMPQLHIYNYADVLVVAGAPVVAEEETHAITNPILIIEVLSDSTEGYDRKNKFNEYKTLPSFREYVLIHQDKPQLDAYFLENDGHWRPSETSGLDSEMFLASINIRLPLSKVYRRVSFETGD